MPNDKKLPATIVTNSTLPMTQSDGLVARGLLAVRQSVAVTDKGDAESLFKQGMRYLNGEIGTPQSYEQARAYLLAAAELNHAEAQFELCLLLGLLYEWPEAIAWLEKSVSLGFGPAQLYLARFRSDPLIADHLIKPNYDEPQLFREASAWYEEQAKAGDPDAQYNFALMHRDGEATNHSRDKAILWMKTAAERDHGFACLRLGEWLLDDKDPQFNTKQGIYWLSRAAELGKSIACRRLGDLYLFGHMGGRYVRGTPSQIVVPDKRQAISWYERQIELDKQRGSYLAMHALARLYLDGEHLDQDLALAERMLLDAANAGNLDSQRLLAFEYSSGKRLKKDTAAALHWLKMAEQNSDSSKLRDQYQLGYFFEHDADGAPIYAEAAVWYRKAADGGDYRSQKRLGEMYESGKGVHKDFVQAFKWYLLSAANSYGKSGIRDFHAGALGARDLLAQKMTAPQLAESRQLARSWIDEAQSLHAIDHELATEGLDRAS